MLEELLDQIKLLDSTEAELFGMRVDSTHPIPEKLRQNERYGTTRADLNIVDARVLKVAKRLCWVGYRHICLVNTL